MRISTTTAESLLVLVSHRSSTPALTNVWLNHCWQIEFVIHLLAKPLGCESLKFCRFRCTKIAWRFQINVQQTVKAKVLSLAWPECSLPRSRLCFHFKAMTTEAGASLRVVWRVGNGPPVGGRYRSRCRRPTHATSDQNPTDCRDAKLNPVTDQISKVKNLARTRLGRFTNLDIDDCKEVFLFENDMYCGITISLGEFQAKWLAGDSAIVFLRSGKPVDRVSIDPTPLPRAA